MLLMNRVKEPCRVNPFGPGSRLHIAPPQGDQFKDIHVGVAPETLKVVLQRMWPLGRAACDPHREPVNWASAESTRQECRQRLNVEKTFVKTI